MSEEPLPQSEIILYQTEDGRTRIQCRFENETLWLTQKLMAELFGKDVRTINEHIQNVLAEGELVAELIAERADSSQPNMGLMAWCGRGMSPSPRTICARMKSRN